MLPVAARVAMTDQARAYADFSMIEMADLYLSQYGRGYASPAAHRPRLLDPADVYTRAMTTSDFPGLLAAGANKILRPAYEMAMPTYRRFCQRMDLGDFKPTSAVMMGDFPEMRPVGQNGRYEQGAMSESAEQIQLEEYGRIVLLSRKAIINDDLNGFARIPLSAAESAAAWENVLAFKVLLSNSGAGPTLTGNVALFHSSRGNLASVAAAVDVNPVGLEYAAIQLQKSLDGLPLNLVPAILLTGPAHATRARQFVNVNMISTKVADVNPYSGELEAVSDANITDNAWYLFCAPRRMAALAYSYRRGQSGPVFQTENDFDTAGIKMKLTEDFGVGAIDWRGCYRNAGVAPS